MNKKLIAVILGIMLCLCFAFFACGVNPEEENTTEESGGNTQQGGGEQTENPDGGREDITQMYIYVNDNKLTVTLEHNSAVEELVKILEKGDITYTSHANGFEIYGDIGHRLPTDDTWITSQSGDVLLWAQSNICIFFGNNSYSYTRIGKIQGYTASQLKEILAQSDSVQVKLSLK